VKILDFGVSKFDLGAEEAPTRLTAEGTLVGTPYYMSPEQASGKKVDARTDVYAMGVIL
ncbi:MAG TPA: serine/threonine protein kinase, partial [Myxococcales bacterium]|nr:serine/threonine protein kinase [Myxococcales bacterium]